MEKAGIKQFIAGGAFIFIGVYMFFNPIGTFNLFTSILGIITIAFGSIELYSLIQRKQTNNFQKLFGYIAIIFGGIIMLIARNDWINIVGYSVAIFFLITGITRMIDHYKKREIMPTTFSIFGMFMTFLGIVFLGNPEAGISFFTYLLSVSLIFAGISQFVIGIALRKISLFNFDNFKQDIKPKQNDDDEVIDVDYKEFD